MTFANNDEKAEYYKAEVRYAKIAKEALSKIYPNCEICKAYVIESAPFFEEDSSSDKVHLYLTIYFKVEKDVSLTFFEIMKNGDFNYLEYETVLDEYEIYKKNMLPYVEDSDDDYIDEYDYYYDAAIVSLTYLEEK